jgi:transposase InsO family protein
LFALSPAAPSQVWGTDITFLWTQQGWIYLAVVIDLYSRRVIGCSIDQRMKKALVARALMMAINLRKPPPGLIHHSGRGSQYASHAYQALLKQHGMIGSMSRKGNCWDNAPEQWIGSRLRRAIRISMSYSHGASLPFFTLSKSPRLSASSVKST